MKTFLAALLLVCPSFSSAVPAPQSPLTPAMLLDFPAVNLALGMMFGQGSQNRTWNVKGTLGGLPTDYAVTIGKNQGRIRGTWAGREIDVVIDTQFSKEAGVRMRYQSAKGLPVEAALSVGSAFEEEGTVGGISFKETLRLNPTAALDGKIYTNEGRIGGAPFTLTATATSQELTIQGTLGQDPVLLTGTDKSETAKRIEGDYAGVSVELEASLQQ